ncbi:MAG: tRNA (adenosine(37)-N6)-threonylcarbamoyltransferase complex ATPase subunit type 1 TsaE [Fibrobacter sp.]|nr:tRNA (adenosine(37)-N6)-threonylcarbamoyltransferase complex ATPase subunit type 1 TsaE [Fibrobacter sp.]
MVFESQSVEETRKFGAKFAETLKPGDVIALDGDLGTGKTEFVRGLVAALGGSAVRSPTFTIVNTYQTMSMPVYHFDFYRMTDSDELFEIGFYEYVAGDGVCLIEWGTMFQDALPENTRILKFKDAGETIRTIET